MASAEVAGVESDFHRVLEHFGDGLGVLGAVTHGDEAYTLDEQHLRSIAVLLHIGFDLPFGVLYEVFASFEPDVLRLAVDDSVGSERCEHLLRVVLENRADYGIVAYLERLESAASAAQDGAYGGDGFGRAVADSGFAFGQGCGLPFYR